jgi:type IV secretory pathway VirB10-like protein
VDKYSYRFAVASLSISIILLSAGSLILCFLEKPISAQIGGLATAAIGALGFLLVPPPSKQNAN